jgi:hypothetical protein
MPALPVVAGFCTEGRGTNPVVVWRDNLDATRDTKFGGAGCAP